MSDHPCKVCGRTDPEKPMCFKGEDWCCGLHAKVIRQIAVWPDTLKD